MYDSNKQNVTEKILKKSINIDRYISLSLEVENCLKNIFIKKDAVLKKI